jgi:hypothetical protein
MCSVVVVVKDVRVQQPLQQSFIQDDHIQRKTVRSEMSKPSIFSSP